MTDGRETKRRRRRVALYGPARSRVGTGPFLARWCERAGLEVVACAGRDLERTRAAAARIVAMSADDPRIATDDDERTIAAFDSLPQMLVSPEVAADALVIATPPATHRRALRTALLADPPLAGVLCEKPLVEPDEIGSVDALLDGYLAAGVLLVENCQWPEVLAPAFDRLWPGWRDRMPQRVAMGLAPVGRGLDMVLDSLSHLLSVLQALLPIDASTRIDGVRFATRDDAATEQDLEFELSDPFPTVTARLALRQSRAQPRPAWIAIDGRRVDRKIRMADYAFGFVRGDGECPDPDAPVAIAEPTDGDGAPRPGAHGDAGRDHDEVESVDDPLGSLVYRFANSLQVLPDPELILVESERIRQRCRLFDRILSAW